MVSAPLAAARAATTELSTPPDIATTMRRACIGPANWNSAAGSRAANSSEASVLVADMMPPYTQQWAMGIATSASLTTSTAAPLTIQNGFATSPTTLTNTYAIDPDFRNSTGATSSAR